MKRVGKGFSGVETPLFENMLEVREVDAEEEVQVPAQDDVDQENVTEEIADDVAQPTSPLPPSPVIPSSPPHQSSRSPPPQAAEGIKLVVDQEKDAEIKGRQANTQEEIYNIDLDHSSKVLSMQEDNEEVQEAVEIVTTAKLMTEVVTAATTQVVAASTPISAAKPAAKPKVLMIVPAATTVSTRKRKGVVIRDPEEELHDDTPAETLSVKDKGKEEEEIIKSINETPAQKAAKRRRLREQAKEDENLKKHLEVVVDEDDDVFVEATPIGRKSNVNAARLELKLFRDAAAAAAHMK
uniref:Uncharacterized protein n=1 Tax=Tanacetum cinerariifolium TaxID=118510 RepID=A0A6L2NAT6_TANCI|nr:hypothetical protein [Tanacetum cinerariifolium]